MPNQETIGKVISALNRDYILQNERDISAYLGVQVSKDTHSKTITLSQPGLIAQLLQDIGSDDFSKSKDTPADTILYADKDGLPQRESWNYHSIIGKLNYLANNTRPDISMAVHQCTRFSSEPILHPTNELTLDMHVDSDFAGMWHKDHSKLCNNVLSRTGYVILFGGCLITWVSKLQTEIALSTTES
jgi:hypothetical protein